MVCKALPCNSLSIVCHYIWLRQPDDWYDGIITVALFFVAIQVLNSWKLVTIFYDQNKLYEQKWMPLKLSTLIMVTRHKYIWITNNLQNERKLAKTNVFLLKIRNGSMILSVVI